MEFDIDYPTVITTLNDEYSLAKREIAELGVLVAHRRSCDRHDDRLTNAPDAKTLACKAGCSWCCYFSVDVRAVEALTIADYMQQALPPSEQERIRGEIETNRRLLQGLNEVERVQRNIKCPFLSAGRCTIYSVRPQTCRNYHATNATGCKQSFEEPNNLDIDPDFAPLTYQLGAAHVDAFSKAMADAGYDTQVYELSTALSAILKEPAMKKSFLAGEPISQLEGTHVELQFGDLIGNRDS